MKRTIEDEVMTARMWIEYGKMHNNLVMEGFDPTIGYFPENDENDAHYEHEYSYDKFPNPYLAMKDLYFTEYLDQKDYVDVKMDLNPNLLEFLHFVSDKDGVTVDEVVNKMISEVI